MYCHFSIRLIVPIIATLLGCAQFAYAKAMSSKTLLAKSALHFDKGEYAQALELLKNIEIRADFDNSEDMLKAFKIKAISYSETGQKTKAAETIRDLYFLNPEYKFTPFDTPTSTLELAQAEHKTIEEKNAKLATAKQELLPLVPPAPMQPPAENFIMEKKIYIHKKPHFLLSAAPFGINHFLLDSPIKGTIYATTQALGLAANIGSFWLKQSYLTSWGSNHLKNINNTKKFEGAQSAQYIGLGSLILGYVISVVDALIELSKIETHNLAADETT